LMQRSKLIAKPSSTPGHINPSWTNLLIECTWLFGILIALPSRIRLQIGGYVLIVQPKNLTNASQQNLWLDKAVFVKQNEHEAEARRGPPMVGRFGRF
jgi:hypothetical protein